MMNKKILCVDYDRGSVDFAKSKTASLKKYFKEKIVSSLKEINLWYDFHVSKDHSVSYDLLKKVNIYFDNVGLIVFDQHMDIWSEKIIGEELNKSNFIRKALNEGLVDFVIFIGVRKSELASFKRIFWLNCYDKKFTKNLRKENEIKIFKDRIKIIRTKNFIKGFNKAMKILKRKNIQNICLDIDLDVFDSDSIKGVEYTKENLKNTIDEDTKKYIQHSLSQKGISPKINFGKIKERNINIIYKHITEFNPKFDDGKTLNLIKELVNGI